MVRPERKPHRWPSRAALVGIGLLLCACEYSPLTQIKVQIEADPELMLDEIELEVLKSDGNALKQTRIRTKALKTPTFYTVTLVRDSGDLDSVRLVTRGKREETVLIEHKLDVSFEEDGLWDAYVLLSASCQPKSMECAAAGQTCEAGECVDIPKQSSSEPGKRPGSADDPNAECAIELPRDGQNLFVGVAISVAGRCRDASGAPIVEGLSWRSDLNGKIGDRASQMIKSDDLILGNHQLTLCIGEGDERCSKPRTVTVWTKPKPPSATIRSVTQKGAPDGGPFSTGEVIAFEGAATAFGIPRLRWTDSIMGDLNSFEGKASMSSPVVGHHQVTFEATDEAGQTPEPPVTVVFDVIDSVRFEAGERNLVQPFPRVNATLKDSDETAVIALASDVDGLVFFSNGEQVYSVQGDRIDAGAEPAIAIENNKDVLKDVRAIALDGDPLARRVYFGTPRGVVVCNYASGELPIPEGECAAYVDASDNLLMRKPVTAIAWMQVEDRRWVAVGTDTGLWVASDDAGVPRDSQRVTHDGEEIRGLVSSGGTFWFGTPTTFVYQYDPASPGSIPALALPDAPTPPMSTLCVDTIGGLWLGTEEAGVSRFEPPGSWDKGWLADSDFAGLASNRVNALAATKGIAMGVESHVVWVGTDRGLTRLAFIPTPTLPTFTTETGLPSNDIRALAILPTNGALLIGTTAGLALYDGS